jgi:hypothetical protein
MAGIGGPSGNSTTVAVIANTSASQNGQIGFVANGGGSGLVYYNLSCGGACVRKMDIFNSHASNNGPVNGAGVGVYSSGTNTTATVSGSTMTNNLTSGLYQFSQGVLKSSGNNVLSNNGSAPTIGTITTGGLLY